MVWLVRAGPRHAYVPDAVTIAAIFGGRGKNMRANFHVLVTVWDIVSLTVNIACNRTD